MNESKRVLGSKALIAKLQRISLAASGVVADAEIERLLLSRVRGRFEQGVAPDGTPWPGLLEETVESKKRHGFKNPEAPLQASGRLLRSIQIIRRSNEGLLAGNTGAGFRIGISDKIAAVYGRLHNYGITQERRQFIGLGRLDVVAVSGLLRRRLKSIAKA